ncbi:MAG: isopentenyl-diphosphate Delta-isomerase [Paracoccaceae bacterium]|nr:NUDIX domain-containing protein [Paracoccaceae bacterium]NCX55117.1 NUDIX domain-containing protein [Rhodobacterales bacterium]
MTIYIPAWQNGTLQPVEKLEVHKLGLRHKAVSVFVFYQGQLLIQQRAMSKYHSPGKWANTCCTHPEWDEDDLACAHRRLEDELGMRNMTLVSAGELEYRAHVGNDLIEHEVVQTFVAVCEHEPSITPNPDEVMAYNWVDPITLERLIATAPDQHTEWLKIYFREHFDALFAKGFKEAVT